MESLPSLTFRLGFLRLMGNNNNDYEIIITLFSRPKHQPIFPEWKGLKFHLYMWLRSLYIFPTHRSYHCALNGQILSRIFVCCCSGRRHGSPCSRSGPLCSRNNYLFARICFQKRNRFPKNPRIESGTSRRNSSRSSANSLAARTSSDSRTLASPSSPSNSPNLTPNSFSNWERRHRHFQRLSLSSATTASNSELSKTLFRLCSFVSRSKAFQPPRCRKESGMLTGVRSKPDCGRRADRMPLGGV